MLKDQEWLQPQQVKEIIVVIQSCWIDSFNPLGYKFRRKSHSWIGELKTRGHVKGVRTCQKDYISIRQKLKKGTLKLPIWIMNDIFHVIKMGKKNS